MHILKTESQQIFNFISRIIIYVIISIPFIYFLYNLQYKLLNIRGNILFIFLYLFIFGLFSNIYKCFEIGIFRLRELILSYSISIVITNFITYIIISLIYKEFLNVFNILILILLQSILGIIFYWSLNKIYFFLHPPKNCLVICRNTQTNINFINKFNHYKKRRYKISLICFENEDYNKIISNIDKYQVVILGDASYELRLKIINYCFEKNKRLFSIPTTQDILTKYSNITQINDTPVLVFKNKGLSLGQLFIKRTIDIIISLLFILITFPIILLTAILIKAHDKGPVFYKQERYTKDMHKFKIVKLRSMEINSEKNGPQITTLEDKRITPIGRFIRLTHIDELPQLFNILRGEMSLVGPRAERIENVELYNSLMPEFNYRMKVKAGLTGYAQIYGQYNTDYTDKLKMDLHYIENFSILLDIQLLLATIKVIFTKEKTEGFINTSFIINDTYDKSEKNNIYNGEKCQFPK